MLGTGVVTVSRVVRETFEQRCYRGEGMSKHISGKGAKALSQAFEPQQGGLRGRHRASEEQEKMKSRREVLRRVFGKTDGDSK